ncbi:MAG: hypothetical protein IJ329_01190 [Clostridia bacterium]|nr:hypothetical protein [Clostridia bacterium]
MSRLLIQRKKPIYLFAFLAVELAAWFCVLFLSGSYVRFISYGAVALALVFAALFVEKRADTLFAVGGLFFTCIADIFLVLLQKEGDTLAMCVFLCAQLCYAGRTYLLAEGKKERLVQVTVRIIGSIVGGAATWIIVGATTQAVFVISVVYYVNLVCSIVFSFLHWKKHARARYMAIGFLSFALCDLSIGFDFLIDIFSLGETSFLYRLMHANVSFVDLFYPPSQAILGASVYPENK